MKPLLIFIAAFAVNIIHACPYCNIHNYLHSSVKNSTLIYKGEVLRINRKNKASIRVLEVIRSGKTSTIEPGEIRKVNVYHEKVNMSKQYIFSNPVSDRPTYPILSLDYEEEIKFLADSTRTVTSIEEAIRRIEGVSTYSTYTGLKYVQENYDSCYPHLVQRTQDVRSMALKNPDYFFAGHRMKNLIEALLLSDNKESRNFLLDEIDMVMASQTIMVNWKDIPAYRETLQGTYFRAMLEHSKELKKTNESIRLKICEVIKNNDSANLVFCAYALAFDDYQHMPYDELSKEQKNFIALGFVHAVSWNRMYWANLKENPSLIALATELSSNNNFMKLIEKNFKLK